MGENRPHSTTAAQARGLMGRGPVEPDRPWRSDPKTATERQAAAMLAEPDSGNDSGDDRPTPTRSDLNRAKRSNERLREELRRRS